VPVLSVHGLEVVEELLYVNSYGKIVVNVNKIKSNNKAMSV